MHSRIDATEETNRLGRLIGHKHTQDSPNLVSKCFMENGIPRLIFLAACNIKSGDELLYDYGDREKSTVQELPWLLPAGDQPKTVPPVPLAQSPAPVAPPQTSFKTPTTRTKQQARKKLFGSSSAGSQTDLSLTDMGEELQEELHLYSQLQSEPEIPGRLDSQSQSQLQTPGTPYTLHLLSSLTDSPTSDAPQPAQKKTLDERSPQKDPEAKRLKTTLEAPQDQGLGEVAQQKTLHERSPPKDLPPKRLKTTLGTEDVQQESQSSGSVEKDLEKLNLDGKLRINYKKLINCQHIIV